MGLLTIDVILKSMKYGITCHIKTKSTPFFKKREKKREYKRRVYYFYKVLSAGECNLQFPSMMKLETLGYFLQKQKGWILLRKDNCLLRQKTHTTYYKLFTRAKDCMNARRGMLMN